MESIYGYCPIKKKIVKVGETYTYVAQNKGLPKDASDVFISDEYIDLSITENLKGK